MFSRPSGTLSAMLWAVAWLLLLAPPMPARASNTQTLAGESSVRGGFPMVTITPRVEGGHGRIDPDTPQVVPLGGFFEFELLPDPGYRIGSVTGCNGVLNGSTYLVRSVEADCEVVATFASNSQAITITPRVEGGHGRIDPDTPQTTTADSDDAIEFTLTPDPGYALASVAGCGGSLAGNIYAVRGSTARVDCEVVARFGPLVTVTPRVEGGNGRIDPDAPQAVAAGGMLTFTLIPDAGYSTGSVTGCDGVLIGDLYMIFSVTADCEVVAAFALDSRTITITPLVAGGHGRIDPDTPQTTAAGSSEPVEFVLTPDAGYRIGSATGCNGWLLGDTYSVRGVDAQVDCTVVATFTSASGTVTVTPRVEGGNGRINPDTPQTVSVGALLLFTLMPDHDYRIDTVTGCDGTLNGLSYVVGPVSGDCEVVARFVSKLEILTVTPRVEGGNGRIEPDVPQRVAADATVSFRLHPDAGFLPAVEGCGGTLAADVYTTAPVRADCEVVATFVVRRRVTPAFRGGGRLDPGEPVWVEPGTAVTFEILPDYGYRLAAAEGCGGRVDGTVFVTAPIQDDCTVAADFTAFTGAQHAAVNDTGASRCTRSNPAGEVSCTDPVWYGQDAAYGRDAQAASGRLTKTGGGVFGFDFTKLAVDGKPLPPDAGFADGWTCVRDNTTGLIWEAKVPSGTHAATARYTWDEARTFAEQVAAEGLCGYHDWRLPRQVELFGLVNFTPPALPIDKPMVDMTHFPLMLSTSYWTSEPLVILEGYAWNVDFAFNGVSNGRTTDEDLPVMLVRGDPATPRFTVNGDGTVSDARTGLMWDRCARGQTFRDGTCVGSPEAFMAIDAFKEPDRRNQKRHRGYADWRLPNIKELDTLLDLRYVRPATDSEIFPNLGLGSVFWTSTTEPGSYLGISFMFGTIPMPLMPVSEGAVRLVRSGDAFSLREPLAVAGHVVTPVPVPLRLELSTSSYPHAVDLVVASGQSDFVFPRGIGSTATYAVAASEPSGRYACEVRNGDGIARGRDVDDVLVACESLVTDTLFASGFE